MLHQPHGPPATVVVEAIPDEFVAMACLSTHVSADCSSTRVSAPDCQLRSVTHGYSNLLSLCFYLFIILNNASDCQLDVYSWESILADSLYSFASSLFY